MTPKFVTSQLVVCAILKGELNFFYITENAEFIYPKSHNKNKSADYPNIFFSKDYSVNSNIAYLTHYKGHWFT